MAAVGTLEDAIALVFAFDRPGVSAAFAARDMELMHGVVWSLVDFLTVSLLEKWPL